MERNLGSDICLTAVGQSILKVLLCEAIAGRFGLISPNEPSFMEMLKGIKV